MAVTDRVKVSIIVPNYNHSLYLNERINSILAQSFQNFELILLDDCSSDNSIEILSSYQHHPKVSYTHFNQHNSGSTFIQWSKGLAHCVGEYVWIAESDDIAHPEFLATLVQLLDDNKQLAFGYCQSLEINSTSEVIGSYYRHTEDLNSTLWKNDFTLDGKTFVTDYLTQRNCIPNVSAVLFRKNSLIVSNTVKSYRYLGDWLLYIQVLKNKKIGYVARELNYFRTHANTTRSGKSLDDWLYTKKEFHGVFQEIYTSFALPEAECMRLTSTMSLLIDNIVTIIPTITRLSKQGDSPQIAIYASGSLGLFALNLIQKSFDKSVLSILCFIDKKAENHKYELDGIPVISLTQFIEDMPKVPIFIASISYYTEIYQELTKQGLSHLVILPHE